MGDGTERTRAVLGLLAGIIYYSIILHGFATGKITPHFSPIVTFLIWNILDLAVFWSASTLFRNVAIALLIAAIGPVILAVLLFG
jgi:hypothetical protein